MPFKQYLELLGYSSNPPSQVAWIITWASIINDNTCLDLIPSHNSQHYLQPLFRLLEQEIPREPQSWAFFGGTLYSPFSEKMTSQEQTQLGTVLYHHGHLFIGSPFCDFGIPIFVSNYYTVSWKWPSTHKSTNFAIPKNIQIKEI